MIDSTKLMIIIAVVIVAAVLLWFVLTKTSLGKSVGSKNGDVIVTPPAGGTGTDVKPLNNKGSFGSGSSKNN